MLDIQIRDGIEELFLGDTFITNQNYPISILDLKFYLSDIRLVSANNDTVQLKDLWLYDTESDNDLSLAINNGVYSKLLFNFGIPAALNHVDPTTMPNNHPLGAFGNKGMHWTWMAGYKFLKFDGFAAESSVDTSLTIGVSLHTGTDTLFTPGELIFPSQLTITDGQSSSLSVGIQMDEVFSANASDTLDVRQPNQNQSHSFEPLARKFTNRFMESWQIIE